MITPRERVIVAADFNPPDTIGARRWLYQRVKLFGKLIASTGTILKLNSGLRALGYSIFDELHILGLQVMADLKLYDIPETLKLDGMLLAEVQPAILTVSACAGSAGIFHLKQLLPTTEIVAITVLTSLGEAETAAIHGCSPNEAVLKLARLSLEAGVDGIVCAPKDISFLKANLKGHEKLKIITPGIRPSWTSVKGDDQNPDRASTPASAIQAGAHRIVVGRPIVRSDRPDEAIYRIIDEIAQELNQKL